MLPLVVNSEVGRSHDDNNVFRRSEPTHDERMRKKAFM